MWPGCSKIFYANGEGTAAIMEPNRTVHSIHDALREIGFGRFG